eukprot:TRINITY_DN7080_c0_g1_i3.p1 TRINITY_DN7080_c0_g1~~TRINITY_DN7080_c0_g1_i3.p1  ORF type:complete len:103 (-),score=17.21 TRINITY_DN7080_c0_g1_i3:1005-1313(-)
MAMITTSKRKKCFPPFIHSIQFISLGIILYRKEVINQYLDSSIQPTKYQNNSITLPIHFQLSYRYQHQHQWLHPRTLKSNNINNNYKTHSVKKEREGISSTV